MDAGVYDALPAMIINIAQHARIDSGYRLLERCVRHGHDPKMPSLFNNRADVVKLHDGSIGLVIKMNVPASMKAQIYETSIAITKNNLLATECSCRSGSKEGDRVVCVHNLPVAYKVTELLYDGLAEHILLKLASSVSSLGERWTNEETSSVKESVTTLMEATGVNTTEEDNTCIPLDNLLEQFLTGTEKIKPWGRRSKISKSSVQGPINLLCFDSPSKKAKKLKNSNKRNQNDNSNASADSVCDGVNVNDDNTTPQYLRISMLMAAMGKGVGGN